MANIRHRIGFKAPANQVLLSLTTLEGLKGWWTEEVTGYPEVNGKIKFSFRTLSGDVVGEMEMQVVKMTADSVEWKCLSGPAEWIGTNITFNLSESDGQTILLFGHNNWKEPVEFFSHCSMKWATFLLSLRSYIENGKGLPTPNDLKIDNWN